VVTGSILLVLVRDGKTASTVSLANNGVLYAPEQDILWYTVFKLPAEADSLAWIHGFFDTKGSRKMRSGDTIQLVVVSAVTDGFDYVCTPTLFIKQ